ncbi:MAG TPA: TIGR02147 family protein [Bdellovibrionales bacterium]|nr:TIGR02147 family protein [Bdellovibrionales bacterium]
MSSKQYAITRLKDEFGRRVQKNPRYSLRAFASLLKVHPSALSRILSGKQAITPRTAQEIVCQLRLDVEEKRLFLASVLEDRQCNEARRSGEAIEAPDLRLTAVPLDADAFAEVFNLTAHSIMQLTFTEDFKNDPAWIAQKLNLDEICVTRHLEALQRLGFLIEENGRLKTSARHFSAIDCQRTTVARRALQREILEQSMDSLERDPMERRAHYGVTMAVCPTKLPEAKEKIMKFLETMNDFMECDSRKDVYQFAIQLFPIKFKGAER